MSSPIKKSKTTLTTPQSTPNPSLPYDLLLTCLARVSRLHYRTLSHVSKSFGSLLASPDIYKARTLLGCTESCLYVCFKSPSGYHWFTLSHKPNQTLTNDTSKKKKSSGYVLETLLIPHPHPPYRCALVAVGSKIYKIGRLNDRGEPSSMVSILDCKTHTWHEGPSLRVKLMSISASVLDEKIYVAGCYVDVEFSSIKNSFEMFDTKTQIWAPKPIPCPEISDGTFYYTSVCIDGKLYTNTSDEMVAYNPKEDKWDVVEENNIWRCMLTDSSSCLIDNVLYRASSKRGRVRGDFIWLDTKQKTWRLLKGLVGFPNFPYNANIRLADYGGKMAVLWVDETFRHCNTKMVWCAVISLEKLNSCEIWGTVEWFDHVLTIPREYHFEKVLSPKV